MNTDLVDTGANGYSREDLYIAISDFLDNHTASELMEIVVDALRGNNM